MSDLISKDEAIKAIKKSMGDKPLPPTEIYVYFACVDTIKALPSAEPEKIFCSPDAEWIPCSERLPEKDGNYLVCMSWNYRNMDVLMWADGWNCVRNINGKVDRTSEIDGEDIVAWMYLPEPYKGGEDE